MYVTSIAKRNNIVISFLKLVSYIFFPCCNLHRKYIRMKQTQNVHYFVISGFDKQTLFPTKMLPRLLCIILYTSTLPILQFHGQVSDVCVCVCVCGGGGGGQPSISYSNNKMQLLTKPEICASLLRERENN